MKNFKKFCITIMCLLAFFSIGQVSSFAAETQPEQDGSLTVLGYQTDEKELAVPFIVIGIVVIVCTYTSNKRKQRIREERAEEEDKDYNKYKEYNDDTESSEDNSDFC